MYCLSCSLTFDVIEDNDGGGCKAAGNKLLIVDEDDESGACDDNWIDGGFASADVNLGIWAIVGNWVFNNGFDGGNDWIGLNWLSNGLE